jgi:hypothetical protein
LHCVFIIIKSAFESKDAQESDLTLTHLFLGGFVKSQCLIDHVNDLYVRDDSFEAGNEIFASKKSNKFTFL